MAYYTFPFFAAVRPLCWAVFFIAFDKFRKLPHDTGQQRGGLGIGGKIPHIGQGRAGPRARDAAHTGDFLRGINTAFPQDGSGTEDPQRETFRLQLIQPVSRSMPRQHGTAGGNMVQADMPYFMGNGPADFILRGAVIVADNKGLRRFAPQYKAVFVIVRLQIGGAFLNPRRKSRVAKNHPSIFRRDGAGVDGKCRYALFKQKGHCRRVKNGFVLHPVFVFSGGKCTVKAFRSFSKAGRITPAGCKGQCVFLVIFCPKFFVCGCVSG